MDRDSILYRYLRFAPFLLIFLLAFVLFGSRACDLALKGGAKRMLTLARLHNLKTAMSFCTDMASKGEIEFPQTTEELLGFFRKDLGMSEKDIKDLGDLYDGWGRMMVFEGDMDGYIIRSAGPDKKFDTGDDIYLKGNVWGEHVLDGSSRLTLSASALKRQINKLPFNDPTGYYRISLPGSFVVIDNFQKGRSEITFYYARDNYVRISAEPYPMEWDWETELSKKLDDLRLGREKELVGFSLGDHSPVQFKNGNGYKIRMESPGMSARLYDVMGGYLMRIQVFIMASGKDREEIASLLSYAVESKLEITH